MKTSLKRLRRWFLDRALRHRLAELDRCREEARQAEEDAAAEVAAIAFERARVQNRLRGLAALDLYFGDMPGAEPAHLVPRQLRRIPAEPAPVPDEYGFPRTVPDPRRGGGA